MTVSSKSSWKFSSTALLAVLCVWTIIVPQVISAVHAHRAELPRELPISDRLHPQDGPHIDLHVRVEAERVLLEIGINLVFLDWLGDFPREDLERVDASELPRVAKRLEQVFADQVRVTADGVALVPRIIDIGSNDPDEALLPLFPVSGWRGLRKLKLEVAYPFAGASASGTLPNEIALLWPFYPPDLLSLEEPQPPLEIAAEWSAEGLRTPITFTSATPTHNWRSGESSLDARMAPLPPVPTELLPVVPSWCTLAFLVAGIIVLAGWFWKRTRVGMMSGAVFALVIVILQPSFLPMLALGNAGLKPPPEAELREIASALLTNVYRAFDADEESTIYDALARSVSGAPLEKMYRDVRASLVMEEEEGAMSRVLAVEIGSISISSLEARRIRDLETVFYDAHITWEVDGRVTHWGHTHDRSNVYDGRFGFAIMPEGWRIISSKVLSQRRLDGAPDASNPDDEL
ncbi:MAG: hypothetical protein EXS10_06595 [Phycisphaerales bacterium]|nr:hypothetical protein [Phycisphaerales bacterium]